MEYSDDEDFVLSQFSTKEFSETQSADYGEDVIAVNSGIVSLEANLDSEFEWGNFYAKEGLTASESYVHDGIAIEDISDAKNDGTM